LQHKLIQTSQTGGQWYNDTSPYSIPWPYRWHCNRKGTLQCEWTGTFLMTIFWRL